VSTAQARTASSLQTSAACNFFIVGFGRSGSTSLYKYLRQHPEIYMSLIKEPKYFCEDMVQGKHLDRVTELDEYRALFDGATDEKVLGEASTMYILSEAAPANIHAFNPAAKILILLRHPVDFLNSWHALGVREGYETEHDFATALGMEEQRLRSGFLHTCGAAISFRYRHVVRNAPRYVARWYERFGRDQVKVVLFDDLRSDTDAVYRDILKFLGVTVMPLPDSRAHNSTRAYGRARVQWLAHLMRLYAPKLSRARGLITSRSTGIRAALRRLNTEKVRRQSVDPELRRALTEEFTPTIHELERITGRDLSHWLAG